MITEKITSENDMSVGQRKQLKRFFEDMFGALDFDSMLDSLCLSKDSAQEIIEKINLIKPQIEKSVIDVLVENSIVDKRFKLFADLGVITVPENYVHGEQLGSLNQDEFYYFNDAITDANFPNPSRVLKPGDKLWVRAFKQVVPGDTSSEDRMGFLKKLNAVFTGAQGASLVYQQKRSQLPKGFWYCSFDEKERLWKDSGGSHRVPSVGAVSGGGFVFRLGDFAGPWDGSYVILCFCDKKEL
ncbi:MAG: hypothetical protein WCO07_02025 [bacterium]